MSGSFLDGFFVGGRYNTKTKKEKLETRIKDSVLNLVIERDQSFLHTARKNNTSIIVNNRGGGIQQFIHDSREFISFPSEFEDKLAGMTEQDAENYLDDVIKMVTAKSTCNIEDWEESQMEGFQQDKVNRYTDITGKELNIKEQLLEYRESKSEEETKKDVDEGEATESGGGTQMSSGGMKTEEESSVGHAEVEVAMNTNKVAEYQFQDTDLALDSKLPEEVKKTKFYYDGEDDDGYGRQRMSEIEEHHCKELANQILKSFKGRVSKLRTSVPSKKLVAKSLVLDNSEKIYQNKKGDNGKDLNVNLIIDMSGSMSGEPVKNATMMIYIFNEIAHAGKLKGCVIWSETGSRCKVPFPMPREFVKNMLSTGGGEGLGKNLKHYLPELKEVDQNICMTDGQLTDDPILTSLYEKEKVKMMGVYVNKDAKDLLEYTGSLSRWFTTSLVRRDISELCQKLVQIGLRKKGK